MIVFTKSPTSAVSPPDEIMFKSNELSILITSSFPSIISFKTLPGINFLFRPIVEDTTIFFVAPTHIRSSMFIINES